MPLQQLIMKMGVCVLSGDYGILCSTEKCVRTTLYAPPIVASM